MLMWIILTESDWNLNITFEMCNILVIVEEESDLSKKCFSSIRVFLCVYYESEIDFLGMALEIRFLYDFFPIYHIKIIIYDNGGPVANR